MTEAAEAGKPATITAEDLRFACERARCEERARRSGKLHADVKAQLLASDH
jgi:hypothetical protein